MRFSLLAALSLFCFSCTSANPSVIVLGSVIPDPEDGICLYETDDPSIYAFPQMNLDVPRSYNAILSVQNQRRQIISDINVDRGGIDFNFAQVELLDSAGVPLALPATLPNPFRLPAQGFVPSATDPETPGAGLVRATIIPDAYRTSLTAGTEIVASVTLLGTTPGGLAIEASPFPFRIDLCNGMCLLGCVDNPDDSLASCTPGQDSAVLAACLCGASSWADLNDECRAFVLGPYVSP